MVSGPGIVLQRDRKNKVAKSESRFQKWVVGGRFTKCGLLWKIQQERRCRAECGVRSREKEGVLNARGCLSNAVSGRAVGRLKCGEHMHGTQEQDHGRNEAPAQVASRPGKQGPSSLPLGWEAGRPR